MEKPFFHTLGFLLASSRVWFGSFVFMVLYVDLVLYVLYVDLVLLLD